MARPSVELAALINDRRTKAFELRIAHVDDVAIGRQLEQSKVGPGGYKDGLSDEQLANRVRSDVSRGIVVRRRRQDQAAGDLAELIEQTTGRLLRAAMPEALKGSPPHIMAALRCLERLARLRGTDAPTRVDLNLTDEETREIRDAVGQLIAEVHAGDVVVIDADNPDAL